MRVDDANVPDQYCAHRVEMAMMKYDIELLPVLGFQYLTIT